jgi:hypothetical protein
VTTTDQGQGKAPAAPRRRTAKAAAAKPAAAKPAAAPRRHAAKVAQGATLAPYAVHAGPPAWLDAQGHVLAMTPAAYPELTGEDGAELRCLGTCGKMLPAGRFGYIGNKGDGKGRNVECRPDRNARRATKAPAPHAVIVAPAEPPAA